MQIVSGDQLSLDYIVGKVIIGGGQFPDTLGRFSPVVISNTGLTIYGSDANPKTLSFYNTATSSPREFLYQSDSGNLFIFPNQTTTIDQALIVSDRNGTFLGWQFHPAYVSGSTHPAFIINDPPGTTTTTFFNEVWYGFQFITNYYANYLIVSGNAAGSVPGVQALGSDTDIDIYVWPKGAGLFYFNYAKTALGGGATATLGTIGGTGPANAAQNAWLAVKIQGTKYWLPVFT